MNTLIALAPIALLIYLMTRKKSVPSHIALPAVAALLFALKIFYFDSPLKEASAAALAGLLTAWTPILVIAGAVFLFETMEGTGALQTLRRWLNSVSANPVAQLMIIGWSFMFLIEGASGFGTPAALAAPLLVGLGFPPVKVAVMALIMNSVPVSFGAVGIPTWFGLGQLGLSQAALVEVGAKTALVHSLAALVIPVIALSFILPFKTIFKNSVFIYLSVASSVIPYFWLAQSNYEFPSIVGGAVGLGVTILLAHFGVGLKEKNIPYHPEFRTILRATFPLWGTIAILLVTRIQYLKIKGWLTAAEPAWHASLQPVADFFISPSLVLRLENLLGTAESWSHQILYVPSLLPFALICLLTFAWYRSEKGTVQKAWSLTLRRMVNPVLALSGALVFVKLLMAGGDSALTIMIGSSFAEVAGEKWRLVAPYLGALGAFFAGSNTVSNLTFGAIQQSIANNLNLNVTSILALQSVGGAMGNMVCVNNIVAVCAVLGLKAQEGVIIKKTVGPMLLYGLIAAAAGLFLTA